MWSNLPFDLLAYIFSYLSPDSFARAKAACRNWHTCANTTAAPPRMRHPAWFIAWPTRHRGLSCYAHNPINNTWHTLSLDFMPVPIRPIAAIGGLVLLKFTNTTALHLAVCNPFTRQFRRLPPLNLARTNPAVGVVEVNSSYHQVYVAGGMSEVPGGGAIYQPTVEMYDSHEETWEIMSSMPVEFAVRLTVWTPTESVCSKGMLYWITSARAYSVIGFQIGTNNWTEFSVPMADRLEFAALVPRNGNLALVGGTNGGNVCIWELGEDDKWWIVEEVPSELGSRYSDWGSTKCVGMNGAVCLYRDVGSGMIVWREILDKGLWEWQWIEGCCSIRGKQIQNLPIKGLLLHPNLAN
ncbi:F-box/kelch-repeat protein [Forsythia ovata]|uniref:F-box/kelch-repeat protein n=1 Tax=Forsythia ovata TaxID=205694 RepID=A0ABD1PFP1_9LAMI